MSWRGFFVLSRLFDPQQDDQPHDDAEDRQHLGKVEGQTGLRCMKGGRSWSIVKNAR
jgi:hypothetical protein